MAGYDIQALEHLVMFMWLIDDVICLHIDTLATLTHPHLEPIENIEHMQKMFDVLELHQLWLNLKKCKFTEKKPYLP